MQEPPIIYFHVGLGKTASTYLQHRVFPQLKGIKYIPTNQYKRCLEIIQKGVEKSYLVSREFDRQFEREVSWFCSEHPDARIIVVFRKHDKWIASQYRRHVKGGFYKGFKSFIDVEQNKGFWDRKELLYMDKVKVIEKYSTQPPLILFHEDIANDPISFIQKIVDFCDAKINFKAISFKPKHTAWSDKQLLAVKKFRNKFVSRDIYGGRNRLENWIYYRPWWALFHLVMYSAQIIPKSWFASASEHLIHQYDLDKVTDFTKEDWKALRAYADNLSKRK
jgi:hypothetical protein